MKKQWISIKALKPDMPAVRIFADGRPLKAQVHAVLLLVVVYHSLKRYRSLRGLEICGKQRALENAAYRVNDENRIAENSLLQ